MPRAYLEGKPLQIGEVIIHLRQNIRLRIFLLEDREDFLGLIRTHQPVVENLGRPEIGLGCQRMSGIGVYHSVENGHRLFRFSGLVQPAADFEKNRGSRKKFWIDFRTLGKYSASSSRANGVGIDGGARRLTPHLS